MTTATATAASSSSASFPSTSSTTALRQRIEPLLSIMRNSATTGYIGEKVSQLTHALQAAHFARAQNPADTELIIACLLHDIGHQLVDALPTGFTVTADHRVVPKSSSASSSPSPASRSNASLWMGDLGAVGHEIMGSTFLRLLGFSPDVCALVQSHVSAKRYLCATNPTYLGKLSDASRGTLAYQGGPMSPAEVQAFERDPLKDRMLTVRVCDELAKQVGLIVDDLDMYVPLLIDHLQAQEQLRLQREHAEA